MHVLLWIAVILLLILVNALYVMAEFAAVSVRRGQLHELAAGGDRIAARLLPVLDNPGALDRYIAACQVGITLSSLVLGAYGQATVATALEPLLTRWGGDPLAAQSVAATIVLLGLTGLQVLLGELMPKSLALQYPVRAIRLTALPMRFSLRLLAGFIAVLNGSANALLRLFHAAPDGHRHVHSPEEIELLLAESRQGGLLATTEHRRLQQALQLRVRPARQFMVPRRAIAAIQIDTPRDEILRQTAQASYTRFPVYRDSLDDIVGILHSRDLVRQQVTGEEEPLATLLRPPLYVPESVTADRLIALLRQRGSNLALVVNEFGGIEGLVTLADVLAGMLGEISDEFRPGPRRQRPERLPDGRVRLPGRLRLDRTEEWTGRRWQGHADTVAGRLLEVLEHLPEPGETVAVDGVPVTVERVEGQTIVSVLVTPVPPTEEGL